MRTLDVLVPHFNAPEALEVSLGSVRRQTWQGTLRVVVLDDGSEASNRVAAEHITAESGLSASFLANETNRGQVYSRNRLLDSIDASYAAWLDAGDLWYPDKLAQQFTRLDELEGAGQDTSQVWITCDYDFCIEGKQPLTMVQDTSGDQTKALLVGDRLRAYLWTQLASRASLQAVGPFDESLPRLQDTDFVLRFFARGGRFDKPVHTGPNPLCRYDKSHLGRSASQVRASQERIFEKHRTLYRSYGRTFERECRAKADLVAARFALQNQERLRALGYVASAFMADAKGTVRRVAKATQKR